MGYQVYETMHDRFGGYGVSAYCEHPDCNKKINRGVESYCGDNPHNNEYGCCLSFCENHVNIYFDDDDKELNDGIQQCERCYEGKEHFPLKQEHPDWIKHLLTDESWSKWRVKNPDKVKNFISLTQSYKSTPCQGSCEFCTGECLKTDNQSQQ